MAVEPSQSDKVEVVANVLREFHQPIDKTGLLPRHSKGAFTDSLALTHCICWGGAWKMLEFILDNPDAYERLRLARSGRR